jgi:UDP-N-acetylmuramoylalanine--D-glutamate ligase
MKIDKLKEQNIFLAGLGTEGEATLRFLERIGATKVTVGDSKNLDQLTLKQQTLVQNLTLGYQGGAGAFADLDQFDLIIKSPGIATSLIKTTSKITSATEIFFANSKGFKLGVTGSKGKSTTCNFLAKVLFNAGVNLELLGNFGKPMLSVLPENNPDLTYILELSSFQLEQVKHSPDIAIFTSLFPDHLDHHGSFSSYLEAKLNIFRFQTRENYAIFPHRAKMTSEKEFEFPAQFQGKRVSFGSQESLSYFDGENFIFDGEVIASGKNLKIPGAHNRRNLSAAIAALKLLKIDNQIIQKTLEEITPLKHRLNLVTTINQVEYWNDSIATNPDSTMAALDYFKERIGTLFLGGSDRGLDLGEVAEKIVQIRPDNLVFFPVTGERFWQEVQRRGSPLANPYQPNVFFAKAMKEAVEFANRNTPKGKIALLSPACPSFSLWNSYAERGEDFEKEVLEL